MGEFGIFHWLVVLILTIVFMFGRRIPEIMRRLGEDINRRKGPPTHPLPVTSSIETSRRSKRSENGAS